MDISSYLTRENIETAGIVVSIVAAGWAVFNSIRMTNAAQKANLIASQSRDASERAATASEASTEIAQSALRLAEDQWREFVVADLYILRAHEKYSYEVRQRAKSSEYDRRHDGIVVEIVNRGSADALNLRWRFFNVDRYGSVEPAEEDIMTHSKLEPGAHTVMGITTTIDMMEGLAAFRLVLAYRDHVDHLAVFDFHRTSNEMGSRLALQSAFLDGGPHERQLLESNRVDLMEVGKRFPQL